MEVVRKVLDLPGPDSVVRGKGEAGMEQGPGELVALSGWTLSGK